MGVKNFAQVWSGNFKKNLNVDSSVKLPPSTHGSKFGCRPRLSQFASSRQGKSLARTTQTELNYLDGTYSIRYLFPILVYSESQSLHTQRQTQLKNKQTLALLTLALILGSPSRASAALSYDYCYASTTCESPYLGYYSVSCVVSAQPDGTACQFFSTPGVSVHCLGLTTWGTWDWIDAHC